jgi:5-methylcytosine-specific restriction endonuclease McrA
MIPGYIQQAEGFDFATYESEFRHAVQKSLKKSSKQRNARLNTALRTPKRITVTTFYFQRNADVVAEVLFQANGVCQACQKEAPFFRTTDGSPYLEVHHKVQLAEGGEDVVENAIALCPNCHRRAHFGPKVDLR